MSPMRILTLLLTTLLPAHPSSASVCTFVCRQHLDPRDYAGCLLACRKIMDMLTTEMAKDDDDTDSVNPEETWFDQPVVQFVESADKTDDRFGYQNAVLPVEVRSTEGKWPKETSNFLRFSKSVSPYIDAVQAPRKWADWNLYQIRKRIGDDAEEKKAGAPKRTAAFVRIGKRSDPYFGGGPMKDTSAFVRIGRSVDNVEHSDDEAPGYELETGSLLGGHARAKRSTDSAPEDDKNKETTNDVPTIDLSGKVMVENEDAGRTDVGDEADADDAPESLSNKVKQLDKRGAAFVRVGRARLGAEHKRDSSFVRVGKALVNSAVLQPEESQLVGDENSDVMAKRESSFVRVGKAMENQGQGDYRPEEEELMKGPEDNWAVQKFMQFLRSRNAGHNQVKKSGSFIRARASSKLPEQVKKARAFVRVGKSQLHAPSQAQKSRSFVRVSKSPFDDKLTSSFVRVGKSPFNDKLTSSFVRVGKSLRDDKLTNSFVRVGKSPFDDKLTSSFVRVGKSPFGDKLTSSFVRVGKSPYQSDKLKSSFVRVGKSFDEPDETKRESSFVRVGKSPEIYEALSDKYGNEMTSEDAYEIPDRSDDKKSSAFVRFGRSVPEKQH